MRPVQVFRKPCFIDLGRIDVVDLISAAWRHCESSGFVVWAIMLSAKISDCFVSRESYQIPVCLFMVLLIICCPLFWNGISCLSNVMVHP